jgi:hypothetical protein
MMLHNKTTIYKKNGENANIFYKKCSYLRNYFILLLLNNKQKQKAVHLYEYFMNSLFCYVF